MHAPQLGFDELLFDADEQNRRRAFEQETGHLPRTMDKALPFFRQLIERHHAAMLAADVESVFALREDADRLATVLNGGNHCGIIGDDEAPGCVLERETAAAPGRVPLWGQIGDFVIEVAGTAIRIELDGVFGIGSGVCFWPGFGAYCVDPKRPFISETGYRSFLGLHADPVPDMTPEAFVCRAIESYVANNLGGKLVGIDPQYQRGDR